MKIATFIIALILSFIGAAYAEDYLHGQIQGT